MKEFEYGVIITRDEDGYYADVPDLDGCSTSGDNFEELLFNVKEAIESYIGSLKKHREKIPEPRFRSVILDGEKIYTQVKVAASNRSLNILNDQVVGKTLERKSLRNSPTLK